MYLHNIFPCSRPSLPTCACCFSAVGKSGCFFTIGVLNGNWNSLWCGLGGCNLPDLVWGKTQTRVRYTSHPGFLCVWGMGLWIFRARPLMCLVLAARHRTAGDDIHA